MKLKNFALAFAASLCIFTSCSNEADDIVDVDKDVKVKMVLGVGTQSSASRTAISSWNNTAAAVIWQNTDKLSVFATGHTEGDIFDWKTNTGEGDNHAQFEGLSYKTGPYYVVYPAQKNARLNSEGVTLNIPSVQKAVKDSFDPAANIQLGKAASGLEGSEVQMANVCSYFYITVPENIARVTLEASNTNWHLAGTVTVGESGSGGAMIKGFESDCTNKIELNNITESGTYFISFIPSSGVDSDLTVTMYTIDGDPMERTFEAPSNGFILYAGQYYNLGDYTPKP